MISGISVWIFLETIVSVNVLAPSNVWDPDKCAVSASKYALATTVPFHTPVETVPNVVILNAFTLAKVGTVLV